MVRQRFLVGGLFMRESLRGTHGQVAPLLPDDRSSAYIARAAESGEIKVELDELKQALDRLIG